MDPADDLATRMAKLADKLEAEADYGKGSSRETAQARRFAKISAAGEIRRALKDWKLDHGR
jgi:3-isopropylmalate dehydratase small subunit